MAQVIPFPGTTLPALAAALRPAFAKPKLETGGATIARIGRGRSIPKANRPEDQETIAFARMAASFEDRAYALAQTEPDSKEHRLMLHMTGMADHLPRNNLRVFTTPDDVLQGMRTAQRRVDIAHAEWRLADLRRWDAADSGDKATAAYWSEQEDAAMARIWIEYERLIRIPAASHSEYSRKVGHWDRGVGSVEWMRKYKPDLAAVLDDELARLNAEKAERAAARAAKKGAR